MDQTYVIVPAYNEAARIKDVIGEIRKYCKNIIVVDDGSKDDTVKVASRENVTVLRHEINMGKGAALKTGCDYACSKDAGYIITIDADGQHQPKEIPTFMKALEKADIVFSYRMINRKMPFVLRFGNRFINQTLNYLYGIKIKDSQSGYRGFTADAYKKIRWNATDYYMETEMIIKTRRRRLRYAQLPIQTIYGDKYKGTTVLDGVGIVAKMIGGKLF